MSVKLSGKLSVCTVETSSSGKMLWHYCNGCEKRHLIRVSPSTHNDPVWAWNGDIDSPTFSPSVRHQNPLEHVCHYTITDGRVQFHEDSTHMLAGYEIELPNFPEMDYHEPH